MRRVPTDTTHKSICFVTSVFADKGQTCDSPKRFDTSNKYDYLLFTNLDPKDFDTSWEVISLSSLPSSNPIINSRFPKFMGPTVLAHYRPKHTYDIVVYCDGYLTPRNDVSWDSVVQKVKNAPSGLVQTLHSRTVYEECEAIVANRKDTVQAINKLRQFMLKMQTPIDTPMYENTAFAYNPNHKRLQRVFQTFWKHYHNEMLSYRDQPLWASILHRVRIVPHIIGSRKTQDHFHSKLWFNRSFVGFNGHIYVETLKLAEIRLCFIVSSKQLGSSKLRARQIATTLSSTHKMNTSVVTFEEAERECQNGTLVDKEYHTNVFVWLKNVSSVLFRAIQQTNNMYTPIVQIFDPVDSYALHKARVLTTCNSHQFDVILTNNETMTNDMMRHMQSTQSTRFVVVHHHWDPDLNIVKKKLVKQEELRFGYMGSIRSLAHSNNVGDYVFLTMMDDFPICFVDTESGENLTDTLRKQPDVTKLPPLSKDTNYPFKDLVLPFNCHLSIREPQTDLCNFKTTAKVVTAAALGHVIVTTREPSAVELLGPKYPFYFESTTNESIRKMLQTVQDDYKGTKEKWDTAKQALEQVKRSKTLENICRWHYVTLLKSLKKRPRARRVAKPSVLVVLVFAQTNDQRIFQASANNHYHFFQQLQTKHKLQVDLCLLVQAHATLPPIQALYSVNPINNIHNISILQCKPEMEIHELADQLLYRIQKQRAGYYDHVCLLQGNVCFKDAFYKALTLPTDKMLFPFVHRDRPPTPSRTRNANPMVSTAFVSIPSTIVMELSHFPLTPNALDYAPHPHTFMLGGDEHARHHDAGVERNGLYGMIG